MTEKILAKRKIRFSVHITAIFLVMCFTGLLFEVGARIAYQYQDALSGLTFLNKLSGHSVALDPFEVLSTKWGGHWILRPGYTAKPATATNTSMWENVRINSLGFKGPEIKNKQSSTRILALGDSTTFGLHHIDYPRIMEESLKISGLNIEVINGGVEGYSTRNIKYEMKRYIQLKPDIMLLYIGWNDLYSPRGWLDEAEDKLRLLWLNRNILRSINRIFLG